MRLLVTTAAVLLLAGGARAAGPLDGIYRPVGGGAVVVVQNGEIEAATLGETPVKFALDEARKHIDLDGFGVGIYETAGTPDGPELRIAVARGADRPTDFADATDRTVLRLQKAGFATKVWTIAITLVDPRNLSHPEKFQKALTQPGVYWAALVAVALIIFTETGLLVGFLLPGDSLLVVVGVAAFLSQGDWNLPLFLAVLCAAAIVGDTVGYMIGWKTGPAIFNRPSSRFFKQEYLQRARAFYEKHGGKTIVIARFIPIVRTFVPVVAGAARMDYRTFLFYNVFGGIGWIVSMILFGFYLIPLTDPPMQRLLGNPNFTWAKHIDKVVVVVVLLSVAPIVWKAAKHWLSGEKPTAAVVEAVTGVEPPAEAPKPVA